MSSRPNVTNAARETAAADVTSPAAARPTLTAERIVLAAIDLIDAEGLAQLSIRRLGEALGVQGMAVYRHLAGKDAILDGVRQVLIGEFAERMAEAAPFDGWREHLRAFGEVYRDVGRTHPQAFPLLASGADSAWSQGIEAAGDVLNTMFAAGFDVVTAMAAKRTVVRYVIGFSLADAPDETALHDAVAVSRAPARPADATPDDASAETLFEHGLDLILDGLEVRLPPTATP